MDSSEREVETDDKAVCRSEQSSAEAKVKRFDPDLFTMIPILSSEELEEKFCQMYGLAPEPPHQNQVQETRNGRSAVNGDVWGVCSELGFNPALPTCKGTVVTRARRGKNNNTRRAYRCGSCRKQMSQMNSVLGTGKNGRGSFFSRPDKLGRPSVRVARAEILWLIYCMAKGLPSQVSQELVALTYKMNPGTCCHWRRHVRNLITEERERSPPMGGEESTVQVANFVLQGNPKKRRLNNHDSEEGKGMHVLNILCAETGEHRMFQVQLGDDTSVLLLLARNVLPGTRMVTANKAPFQDIASLQNKDGPMRLDWVPLNGTFVDKNSGANVQGLKRSWEKVRWYLRNSRGIPEEHLQSHLDWMWWCSLNGRTICSDPFLRLVDLIAQHYPQIDVSVTPDVGCVQSSTHAADEAGD